MGCVLCSSLCTWEVSSLDHACSWGRSQDRPGGNLDVLLGSQSPSRPSGNARSFQTGLFPQRGPVVTNRLFPAVSCVILKELIRKAANK